jgi:hypothetical protein
MLAFAKHVCALGLTPARQLLTLIPEPKPLQEQLCASTFRVSQIPVMSLHFSCAPVFGQLRDRRTKSA